LAVVVTADCDIAQGKVGERGVACIELKPLRDFMSKDHLSRLLNKVLAMREREFREWIRQKWASKGGSADDLTDGALNEWILSASRDEICGALDIADEPGVTYAQASLTAIQAARAAQGGTEDTPLTLRAIGGLAKTLPKDWRGFVLSQFEKLQANQLADDLFFVTTVPGEDELGFVAKLRSLWFIPLGSVCRDVPEARERERGWTRVGRLAPTFKHGLAQQIGVLFARVGYPYHYEMERNDIFALVAESLADEFGSEHA
jgi:hypothetical protein